MRQPELRLRAAGIPVYGVGGGWSLMEGYRANLTGLSESELQAMIVTRLTVSRLTPGPYRSCM